MCSATTSSGTSPSTGTCSCRRHRCSSSRTRRSRSSIRASIPSRGGPSVAGWPYVLESSQETRAWISGTVLVQNDVMLIRANRPWRADWISSGLYDDGWTRPGTPVHVRVFARPGARKAEVRWLTFGLHSLDDSRAHPVTIVSRGQRTRIGAGPDTSWTTVSVCVPPRAVRGRRAHHAGQVGHPRRPGHAERLAEHPHRGRVRLPDLRGGRHRRAVQSVSSLCAFPAAGYA